MQDQDRTNPKDKIMTLAELDIFQLIDEEFTVTPEAVGLPDLPNVRQALLKCDVTDPNCLFAAFVIAENLYREAPSRLDTLVTATILSGSLSPLETSTEFGTEIQSLVFEVDLQKNLPKDQSILPDFTQFSKDAQRVLLAYDMLFKESRIRGLQQQIFRSERNNAEEVFHQNLKSIFRNSVQEISKIDIGEDQLLLNTYVRNFNDLAFRYNSDTYLCPLKPGDKKIHGSFLTA